MNILIFFKKQPSVTYVHAFKCMCKERAYQLQNTLRCYKEDDDIKKTFGF